jgi:hypothetical protein
MVHGLEGGTAAVAVDAVIDVPDDVAKALVDSGRFKRAAAARQSRSQSSTSRTKS